MKRRNALKAGAAALLSAASVGFSNIRSSSQARAALMKRVRPSDAAWPKPEQWKALADSLEGTLEDCVRPVDVIMAQHGGALDDAARAELQNPFLIQDFSGGTQSAGWLDGWVAQPSAHVVIPRSAQDISKAITFAHEHALRLVVKGGAHSYLGQSNAPDSLMIWTRDLKGLTIHDGFVPQGCDGKVAPHPAVSVASGEKFVSLYDFVIRQHGRYVQGGGCTSVGVGGHLQTGGFGSYSKYGGMTCASLLEAEIVTADGQIRVVNECQNPDLFWAIKGGGAGWGITTRVTLATHELPALLGFMVHGIKARDEDTFRTLTAKFLGFARENLINPTWGEQASFTSDNVLSIQMSFQGLDEKQAAAVWQPFLAWVAERKADYAVADPLRFIVTPARHWWDFEHRKAHYPETIRIDMRGGKETGRFWWNGNTSEVGIFLTGYESLWLPQRLLEESGATALTDALVNASRRYVTTLHFNKGLGGATQARREEARKTAVHPSAIDAFALVIIAGGQIGKFPGIKGEDPDYSAGRTDAQNISTAFAEFRRIAPEAGSYSSEMSYHEPDWQKSAWGENYGRLLEIKNKYDPDGFFTGHHQVGSEFWDAGGFERL